ncbi:hypothetical protein [Rhodoligotrophos defluvii]|uniref:hypothetical protein n=1 Tax=Rhodoligotrophos defluvii TaxID=2561934 RepID=UPI0010CA0DE1|nr:hypothetical protein [Rhodoligotrophos defluvii]
MSVLRLCAVVLAALLVTACQTTEKTTLLRSADRNLAVSQNDGNGVLIVGLQIESIIELSKFDTLEFWTVDPQQKLLIHPDQGGRVIRLVRGNWIFGRDKQGDVEYVLQSLPAGTYYLTYVDKAGELMLPVEPMSFAFTVRPGEATYIGTFDFRPPPVLGRIPIGNYEIRPVERRPHDAKALLAKYPNLPQELWDQQPMYMNLNCRLKNYAPRKECLVGAPLPGSAS